MGALRKFAPSPALVVSVVALVAAVGGIAIAAVPDKQGRIEACYVKKTGAVRLLVKGTKCPKGQKLVRWSQTGPANVAGQDGARGQDGAKGQDGSPGSPGSPAASMLTGSMGTTDAAVGVTQYLHPSGASPGWALPQYADMLSPNQPIAARDLAARLNGPPGAGRTYRFALVVDGVESALDCVISGAVDTTCGDSTDAVTIAPRTPISIQLQVSSGATARTVKFGFRAVTP